MVDRLICRLLGHKWLFNFPPTSQPTKCIYKRCNLKGSFNKLSLEWEVVDKFKGDNRTDEETTWWICLFITFTIFTYALYLNEQSPIILF